MQNQDEFLCADTARELPGLLHTTAISFLAPDGDTFGQLASLGAALGGRLDLRSRTTGLTSPAAAKLRRDRR